ncbi:serine hydrolase domain-containing protein [Luteimonas vadosa]|uniref:Serine hydrolase domain-containing protein n=1 Tax=Luteimonas vadosa TaxID=1165507 RepID=A0ABP9E4J1_9GAMM
MMLKRQLARCFLALLAGCVITCPALAQTKTERIHALMAHYHALGRLHGAVLVAQDGKVVYEGGFGQADATWGIANAADVRYHVASVTKVLTAVLVLQQVERGTLRLDAPVAGYLPDFPVPIDARITVDHLLSNRSGLVDYVNDLDGDEYMARYEHRRVPAETLVAEMLQRPLEFAPGERFDYSNTGYVLLEVLLESVTGRPYCDLLREEVFAPAGMAASGCVSYEPVVARMATAYKRENGQLAHAPFFHALHADGVAYSTVRDLFRFDEALRAGRLLSPAMQAVMATPRIGDDRIGNFFGPGLEHFYGYGLEIHQRPGASPADRVTVVGHSGYYLGWSARLWRVPEDGIAIIVLNNQTLPTFYIELFDILYERPYRLPTEDELDAREGKKKEE